MAQPEERDPRHTRRRLGLVEPVAEPVGPVRVAGLVGPQVRVVAAGLRGSARHPVLDDLDTSWLYPDRQLEFAAVIVDTDDLLNAREVAAELGLAHREAIATYRRRYPDFPTPVIAKGTCVLWHRPDVEAWRSARARGT